MAVTAPQTYLADLNEAQREAVLTTEGPLLVVAGAGSGKTRVLTYRVAHLIHACGVKPNEILAITFTNKAAGEMRERLEGMLGGTARAIWILTFHAACGRILRREAERLGYRSNFTIYDDQDQVRLTKACLEELGKDPKRFSPRGIHHQISQAKNQLVSPEEYAKRVASFWDQTVAEVYELYQRRLHASNAVDFDDLIMLTVEVLERFPEALTRWQKAFRYVLVDEYQDTNHAQYRLLQLLGGEHGNVCAVGDPDQCLVAGTLVTMADGSTKPIEMVRSGDEVLSNVGSGRFAAARVAGVHRSSRRVGVEIVTASGRNLRSTPEHVHFAGFKTGWTPQLHMTYVMWKRGVGFRLGTSRTYTDGRNQPLPGPAFRMNQEHADAAWVVSTHQTEAEARQHEVLVVARLPVADAAVRGASVQRERRTESCRKPVPDRRGLRGARHRELGPSSARGRGPELRSSTLQRGHDDSEEPDSAAPHRLVVRRSTRLHAAATGSRSSVTTMKAVEPSRRSGSPFGPRTVARVAGATSPRSRISASSSNESRTSRASSMSRCASRLGSRLRSMRRRRIGTRCLSPPPRLYAPEW